MMSKQITMVPNPVPPTSKGRGAAVRGLRRAGRASAVFAAVLLAASAGTAYAMPPNKSYGVDACAAAAQKVNTLDRLRDELNDLKNDVCNPKGVPPQFADRTNVYKQCLLVNRMLMWIQQEKSEAQLVVINCHQQGLMDR